MCQHLPQPRMAGPGLHGQVGPALCFGGPLTIWVALGKSLSGPGVLFCVMGD